MQVVDPELSQPGAEPVLLNLLVPGFAWQGPVSSGALYPMHVDHSQDWYVEPDRLLV